MNFEKYKDLPISFAVKNQYTNNDTRFLDIMIDVLHTGKNFNGSIFSKEAVNENIETIKNTPILGYIKYDEDGEIDDFTKHEYELVKKDGEYKYVYTGFAYGVIPESCNPRWIYKVSSDGQTREYLQVDALLWTKFEDAIEIFERDTIKKQSMELEQSSMEGYEDENNNFHFTSFKFDGCCILSTTDPRIQPAMIDSIAVANFNTQTIADEIKQKLNEYSIILQNQTSDSDDFNNPNVESNIKPEVDINKFSQKGGNNEVDEKLKILTKYSLTVEDINFSIEEVSLEDLEAKIKDFQATKNNGNDPEPNKDFTLNSQMVDEIISSLSEQKIETDYGYSYSKYSFSDYDGELSEAYAWDREDGYKLYGFKYSISGDKVMVDFDSKKRKKYVVADFDEGTPDSNFTIESAVKDVVDGIILSQKSIQDKFTALETEHNTLKSDFEKINDEAIELRTFKSEKLDSERTQAEKELFTQFEGKIGDMEEFKTLKDNSKDFSLEDIENKCFALIGKKDFKFAKNTNTPDVPIKRPVVTPNLNDNDPYGGLFSKYGIQPTE